MLRNLIYHVRRAVIAAGLVIGFAVAAPFVLAALLVRYMLSKPVALMTAEEKRDHDIAQWRFK